MTRLQGWLLVVIALIGVGYFVIQSEQAKPSKGAKALTEHYRQMCVAFGQNCGDYRARK